MPNKVAVDQRAKDMIIELGLLIRDCRGTLSQSQLAKRVGLPRSNMKYIEDGVNAPTADVYDKLIKELKPDLQTHHHMDHLYMAIRKVPPPDVCRTITQNKDLVDAMRLTQFSYACHNLGIEIKTMSVPQAIMCTL